jgi:phospholipid transport system substrate-binding protein
MMITRRTTLITLGAGTALAAFSPLARAQAALSPAAAQQFVTQMTRQLTTVVNGSGTLAEKQQALQPMIDRDVDVDGVARFCLGRYWREATPQQQAQYLQLFHSVLVDSITSRIGNYQGVRVTIGRATPVNGEVQVASTVQTPNAAPADVIWVVGDSGGGPKVLDLIAEGTSMRLTQRADYASYLTRNGNSVSALITALQNQVKANG